MHTATELLPQTGAVTPGGLLSHLLPPGPSFVDLKLIHWSIQVSLWSVFISGYGHTFTSGNSSTWANLHFISACLHSSVQTHMHVEKNKKWLPTERGSTPLPSQFRHLNVASLSMYCWWLHAGLQRGHHPLSDWIYGCGSPFPISADWPGANLSLARLLLKIKEGVGRDQSQFGTFVTV